MACAGFHNRNPAKKFSGVYTPMEDTKVTNPNDQHMSGVPCLAFPLHEHVYVYDNKQAADELGNPVYIFKCREPYCHATRVYNEIHREIL